MPTDARFVERLAAHGFDGVAIERSYDADHPAGSWMHAVRHVLFLSAPFHAVTRLFVPCLMGARAYSIMSLSLARTGRPAGETVPGWPAAARGRQAAVDGV